MAERCEPQWHAHAPHHRCTPAAPDRVPLDPSTPQTWPRPRVPTSLCAADESSSEDAGSDAGAGDASDVPLSSRPSSSGLADSDFQPPPGVSWKRSKSKRKLDDKKKKEADYYALLGLQNERWMATDSQIKLGALPLLTLACAMRQEADCGPSPAVPVDLGWAVWLASPPNRKPSHAQRTAGPAWRPTPTRR
jgi:hypothetical protein